MKLIHKIIVTSVSYVISLIAFRLIADIVTDTSRQFLDYVNPASIVAFYSEYKAVLIIVAAVFLLVLLLVKQRNYNHLKLVEDDSRLATDEEFEKSFSKLKL